MSKVFQPLIILCLTFVGCSTPQLPAESNPLWQELELELKFGQTVEIGERLKAVVIDVTKDEGGIWYGCVFKMITDCLDDKSRTAWHSQLV